MPPPASAGNNANENNKRAALAGQWRTPPIPTFPSGNPAVAPKPPQVVAPAQQPPQTTQQPPQKQVDISQLPDSTEDYAKALQEAYRRGAEAAQAMAAAQVQGAPAAAAATSTTTPMISSTSSHQDLQQLQHQQPQGTVIPPPKAETPVVPVVPVPVAPKVKQTSPAPQLVHTGRPTAIPNAPPALPTVVPNPLSMPPPSNMTAIAPTTQSSVPVPIHSTMGPSAVPPSMGVVKPGAMIPPQAQRSMSLPDMSSYAAQQEEEKRQKRLARNRASARLRRLRKKNLVEAYEQEVGILEKTLSQLQAHEWGETDNVAALTEALSMDRGQQVLTFEQRHEAATSLLDQQLQWVEMLEEIMMEDYVLQNVRNGEFAELRDILGLDEEQLNQIEMSKVGWEEEWAALQTLKASINAMRENDWLWNESVSAIAEQFMSILHKNQVSKFLLWADHNAEAIDELDGVNAYPGTPNGPVFTFGVENQPGENYGDEDK